jgi:CTP synthase
MKCIFITGGVYSGLGKWIAAASIAKLIQSMGHSVTMVKMDPYLQIDAGTMSPFEHGEVFVTSDGGETDLDIGNYERYIDVSLTQDNNITSWKIYQRVIAKERRGDYLGQTVQVVPHIVDEIKQTITRMGSAYDVVVVEVWGTVGDIESPAFYEAARQMKRELGQWHVCYVHLAPIVRIPHSGEMKTKPLQHSVRALRETGIVPDMLLCRTEWELPESLLKKIAQSCDLDDHAIFAAPNVSSIYDVPLRYAAQGMVEKIASVFGWDSSTYDLTHRSTIVDAILQPDQEVIVAMAGKYTAVPESYHSVTEALIHAGAACRTRVKIYRLDTEIIEKQSDPQGYLRGLYDAGTFHAILVPGGFGERGVEGMIHVAEFARTQAVPYLGICLWLQVAVIEYSRHMCDVVDATSAEFGGGTHVVALMNAQHEVTEMWGTMRLGSYEAALGVGTLAADLYGMWKITERHRHRYEVNPAFHDCLISGGMVLSGMSLDGTLVEFVELPRDVHPYFIATQAHPEFLSRVEKPHPLFVGLVRGVR